MPDLKLLPNVEGAWPELKADLEAGTAVVATLDENQITLGRLPDAMASGKSVAMLRVDLNDALYVIVQLPMDVLVKGVGMLMTIDASEAMRKREGQPLVLPPKKIILPGR